MKKYLGILSYTSVLITLLATVVTSSSSFGMLHQPKTPKYLKFTP